MNPVKIAFNGADTVMPLLSKTNLDLAQQFGLKALAETRIQEVSQAIDNFRNPCSEPFRDINGQPIALTGATFHKANKTISITFDYSPVENN